MNDGSAVSEGGPEFEGVALVKFKGKPGLIDCIDSDYVEPGAVVPHCGTAGTAEQVEE